MTNQPIMKANPEAARNPLGGVGLGAAAVGLALFVAMIGAIEWVTWEERLSVKSPPVVQAMLFVAGCFTGGISSLVGLGLSVAGLRRRSGTLALWGLALSLLSIMLVVGWYMIRHSVVRLSQ